MQLVGRTLKCTLVLSCVSLLLVGSANAVINESLPTKGGSESKKPSIDPEAQKFLDPIPTPDMMKNRIETIVQLDQRPEVKNPSSTRPGFYSICNEEMMWTIINPPPPTSKDSPTINLIDEYWFDFYAELTTFKSSAEDIKSGKAAKDLQQKTQEVYDAVGKARKSFEATRERITAYYEKIKAYTMSQLFTYGVDFVSYRMDTMISGVYTVLGITPDAKVFKAGKEPVGRTIYFEKIKKSAVRTDRFFLVSQMFRAELRYMSYTNPKGVALDRNVGWKLPDDSKELTTIKNLYPILDEGVTRSHANLCKQLKFVTMATLGYKPLAAVQAILKSNAELAKAQEKVATWTNPFVITKKMFDDFSWALEETAPADCEVFGAKTLRAATSLALIGKDVTDPKVFAGFQFFKDAFFKAFLGFQSIQEIVSFDRLVLLGLSSTDLTEMLRIGEHRQTFHIEFFDQFNYNYAWVAKKNKDGTLGPKELTKSLNTNINADILAGSPVINSKNQDVEVELFILETYFLLYKVYTELRREKVVVQSDTLTDILVKMLVWFADKNPVDKFGEASPLYQSGLFSFTEIQKYYPAAVTYLCLIIGVDCLQATDKFAENPKIDPQPKDINELKKQQVEVYDTTQKKIDYNNFIVNFIKTLDVIEPEKLFRSDLIKAKIVILSIYAKWWAVRMREEELARRLKTFYEALVTLTLPTDSKSSTNNAQANVSKLKQTKGVDPKAAVKVVADPQAWRTHLTRCSRVGLDRRPIVGTSDAPFRYAFTLECTNTLYPIYVKIIEEYMGSSVITTVGEFGLFFDQLKAVMTLAGDFNYRSVINYLTVRYLRSYEAVDPKSPKPTDPKVPIVFLKLFVEMYAASKIGSLKSSTQQNFYRYLVFILGSPYDLTNPNQLRFLRLNKDEAEMYLMDLYVVVLLSLRAAFKSGVMDDLYFRMCVDTLDEMGEYGMQQSGKSLATSWKAFVTKTDALFESLSTGKGLMTLDDAKPLKDITGDIAKDKNEYVRLAKYLSTMHIFSTTTDFFEYFDADAQRKLSNKSSVSIMPLMEAFSTYYHFNLRVRLNFDSDARLSHIYLLEKIEVCLSYLSDFKSLSAPGGVSLQPNAVHCDLSYRKYAELYFFFKMYLRADKGMLDITLENFRPEVMAIRLGTFFFFVINDSKYSEALKSYCDARGREEICEIWSFFLATFESFLGQQTPRLPFTEFAMAVYGHLVSALDEKDDKIKAEKAVEEAKKQNVKLKKLMLIYVEAVYVAANRQSMAVSELFSVIAEGDNSIAYMEMYKSNPSIYDFTKQVLHVTGDSAEVGFLADFFRLNYRKRKLEAREKPIKAVIQAILGATREQETNPGSKAFTLSNFLRRNRESTVSMLKIFLMYSDSMEDFTIVAKYLTNTRNYLQIVTIEDQGRQKHIQEIINALDKMVPGTPEKKKEYLKNPDNVKTLVKYFQQLYFMCFVNSMSFASAVIKLEMGTGEDLPLSDSEEQVHNLQVGFEHQTILENIKKMEEQEKALMQMTLSINESMKSNLLVQEDEEFYLKGLPTFEAAGFSEMDTGLSLIEQMDKEYNSYIGDSVISFHEKNMDQDTVLWMNDLDYTMENSIHSVHVVQKSVESKETIQTSFSLQTTQKSFSSQTTMSLEQEEYHLEQGAYSTLESTIENLEEWQLEIQGGSLGDTMLMQSGIEMDRQMSQTSLIVDDENMVFYRMRRSLRSWMPQAAYTPRRVRI